MLGRFNPAATLFPLMLVGLLAGLSYWLELASQPGENRTGGSSRHDPDYIVERFEVRRFDPHGALQHTLLADSMRHFPDDDSTEVTSPHLTYHRLPPTLVSAREARIDSKGKHVQLIGEVVVTRAAQNGKPASVITTARLDAFPDDEIARTDAPVTITQGRSNVTGSGLVINNAIALYTLDGPVRGVFHRNTSSIANTRHPPTPKVKPVESVALPKAIKPTAKSTPKSRPKAKPKAKLKSKPRPNPKSKVNS